MPRRKKAKRIGGAEKAALEQEKLTERWRTEIFLSLIFLSALSRQYIKRASHPQKAEYCKPGQSHPKPPQGHHKATTKPYTMEYRGTPRPPQGSTKAPPRLHQGSTKATPGRRQKAVHPPQCRYGGREWGSAKIARSQEKEPLPALTPERGGIGWRRFRFTWL